MKHLPAYLLALLLALTGASFATPGMTPANTEITNQASGRFLDVSGSVRTATSNQVVTVVQQVYDLTITPAGTVLEPGQSRFTLAGGSVQFAYMVFNTGNGVDTIALSTASDGSSGFDLAGIRIVLDANCNGQAEAPEAVVGSLTLAAGEHACVVVAGSVPSAATAGSAALVDLVGASQGDSSVTKSDHWAKAVVTNGAVLTLAKSASPTFTVAPGGVITYTLAGSNNGGASATPVTNVVTVDGDAKNGILVSDVIPAGLAFVHGSLAAVTGDGTATRLYRVDGAWTAAQPDAAQANDVEAVGLLIEGSFRQGASYSLTFRAQVPENASAAERFENTATVRFDGNGDGDGNDDGETVASNTTRTNVGATYGVAVGPYTDPGGTNTGTYSFLGRTITFAADESSVASASTGQSIAFRFTLANTGNASDAFDLAVTTKPTDWTCFVRHSDGTTPLTLPVAPLPATAQYSFSVACLIPAAPLDPDFTDLVVTATSRGNGHADTTYATIGTLATGFAVDVDARDTSSPVYDSELPLGSVDLIHGSARFEARVTNTGDTADSYALTVTNEGTWPATIHRDDGCSGTPGATTSGTRFLGVGDHQCFVITVAVPQGARAGAYGVTFTATSQTVSTVADSADGRIDVTLVEALEVSPDQNGTVTTPGVRTYAVAVTNRGNATTNAAVTLSQASGGWSYALKRATDTTWSTGPLVLSGLEPNASVAVDVRVQAPAGAVLGSVDFITVLAAPDASGSGSATLTTVVIGGELELTKTARTCGALESGACPTGGNASSVRPGGYIHYTVVAQNIGTDALRAVHVLDPLPRHTNFVSITASTNYGGTVLYRVDDGPWSAVPPVPASVPSGSVLQVGVATTSTNDIGESDVMNPADRLTIDLVVRVR